MASLQASQVSKQSSYHLNGFLSLLLPTSKCWELAEELCQCNLNSRSFKMWFGNPFILIACRIKDVVLLDNRRKQKGIQNLHCKTSSKFHKKLNCKVFTVFKNESLFQTVIKLTYPCMITMIHLCIYGLDNYKMMKQLYESVWL